MKTIRDIERCQDLKKVLMSYTSNNFELDFVINMEDNNPDITPKDYVLALADGLKYGNWPWIERHSTRALMNTSKYINSGVE